MLETERLVLRRPSPNDADDLLELVGDEELMRWIGGGAGDRAVAVESIERWIGRWEANGVGQFAAVLDGHVIGRVGLLVWDESSWETSTYERAGTRAVTELGWAIARRHWGHGYATEAARAVRAWAYEERAISRLVSLIDPRNVRSIRVAEKLGAEPEQLVPTPHGPAVVWVHPR
ncbi:MAG TPA: GNAT family N-acetyltransferase [Gaiellaceae bacterium]|nr:GNAT family N-acetyltransferase [Gaiellaceae bacterium]